MRIIVAALQKNLELISKMVAAQGLILVSFRAWKPWFIGCYQKDTTQVDMMV